MANRKERARDEDNSAFISCVVEQRSSHLISSQLISADLISSELSGSEFAVKRTTQFGQDSAAKFVLTGLSHGELGGCTAH